MSPPKERFCVAVVENSESEILLLLRSRHDSFAPGVWGLPGGHMRFGENPEQTMARELAEEVGTDIRLAWVGRFGPVRDTWYGGVYEVHLFRYRFEGGSLRLGPEHERHAWVGREAYRGFTVVDGVDEDLAYLKVWPPSYLNPDKLPGHLRADPANGGHNG